MMGAAFFKLADDGNTLLPQATAVSGWGAGHMRGMAVSAALARTTEFAVVALDRADLQPTRWTLDLFRVARLKPTTTTATVTRLGRRLCLIDSQLHQDGHVIARASALFLSQSESPAGPVWTPTESCDVPPVDYVRSPDVERLYRSDKEDWSLPRSAPLDGYRKHIWQYPIATVEHEELSPFQMLASAADLANATVNLGAAGLEFVNADVTLVISRLPEGTEIGLRALTREERHGLAVGSAHLFDRTGAIGIATICALANAENAVDLRAFGHAADA